MAIEMISNGSNAGYQEPRQVQRQGQYASPEAALGSAMPNVAVTETAQADGRKGTDTQGQQGNQNGQGVAGQATEQQIKVAVQQANKRARFGNTNAQFAYHEKTKRITIKILDKETQEVIKEIPPEETLEMISKMWELAGILVDEKR